MSGKCILMLFSVLLFVSFSVNSSLAISIPEENKAAEKFMEMVNNRHMILNDPIANHMITQVGRHILSFLPPQPFDYSFYIVDEDVFNAFASAGANIFAYRGLITSLDSIDELAGIIGHEIAHAVSRHVSESIDRSKFLSIGSLAGMLAGAIIGSQSNGNAGATLMTGSMALGQTAMLAFTRDNETEADEKGIMFLKRSCFSPEGLLSGLMKIRATDYRGTEGIPDYVKTHPGTGERIAHVETILSGYVPPEKKVPCPEDFRFDMVKYRLLGLYAEIKPTFDQLTNQLGDIPPTVDAGALHYGMGLVCSRKSMGEDAIFHLRKALSIHPFDPMILVEMGRIYLLNGEPEKALVALNGIESDPVVGLMVKFHQAAAYLELRHLSKAKTLFNTVIKAAPTQYPKAYYHLANILSLENEKGLSHYYLGLYYAEIDTHKTAIVHLKKALDDLTDDADIKKATQLLNRLKKEATRDKQKK
ncbi:M48 family metallopeptidase [Desulfobacula sp.]|uniref:M48 family metallopeptidase n=1 Tax=Desulfobacula sp. TaxID=2593537 RepID=UPI0026284A47|nr:M48 family metallopeptidase [Desulfobacula sp.]